MINKDLVKTCAKAHIDACENWEHGGIAEVWRDERGILCIRYESGRWWHYRNTGVGIEWW